MADRLISWNTISDQAKRLLILIAAMAVIRSTNLALLVIVNKTWKLLLWRGGMLLALEIMLLTIRRCYILPSGVSWLCCWRRLSAPESISFDVSRKLYIQAIVIMST